MTVRPCRFRATKTFMSTHLCSLASCLSPSPIGARLKGILEVPPLVLALLVLRDGASNLLPLLCRKALWTAVPLYALFTKGIANQVQKACLDWVSSEDFSNCS